MRRWGYLALAMGLVSCGGGDGDGYEQDANVAQLATRFESASSTTRQRPLALPTGADPQEAANRLFAFAESQAQYRWLFPRSEPTRSMGGWWYRHYPQSGVYLAVINWRVYVLGGPLGNDIRDVGAVETFITLDPTPAPPPAPNKAPLAVLNYPTASTPVQAGTAVTVHASAGDADGSVMKVEFFVNGQSLGEDPSAPYSISWRPSAPGSYSLVARATDDKGAIGASNAVTVTVSAAPAPPPPPPPPAPSLSALFGRVTFNYTYGLAFTDIVDFSAANLTGGSLVAPFVNVPSMIIGCVVADAPIHGYRYFCTSFYASGGSDQYLFNVANGVISGKYTYCPAASTPSSCLANINKPPNAVLSGHVRSTASLVPLRLESPHQIETEKQRWDARDLQHHETPASAPLHPSQAQAERLVRELEAGLGSAQQARPVPLQ